MTITEPATEPAPDLMPACRLWLDPGTNTVYVQYVSAEDGQTRFLRLPLGTTGMPSPDETVIDLPETSRPLTPAWRHLQPGLRYQLQFADEFGEDCGDAAAQCWPRPHTGVYSDDGHFEIDGLTHETGWWYGRHELVVGPIVAEPDYHVHLGRMPALYRRSADQSGVEVTVVQADGSEQPLPQRSLDGGPEDLALSLLVDAAYRGGRNLIDAYAHDCRSPLGCRGCRDTGIKVPDSICTRYRVEVLAGLPDSGWEIAGQTIIDWLTEHSPRN